MTEEAPAPAPESTANTNTENAAPAEQTPAQPAETTPTENKPEEKPYFSSEQLAEMQKFIENNGGYDSAWKKMKAGISNPKPVEPKVTPSEAPQNIAQPEQPAQPQEGHMTRDEFFATQYFESLAKRPEYKDIADKIRNGDALREMSKFGLNPINGGDINDAQTRQFLDMYAAANAPKQPETPVTNTPTVEYAEVKEIKSMADVDEIMRQNINLKAQGLPLHPQTEAAKAFAQEFYKKK